MSEGLPLLQKRLRAAKDTDLSCTIASFHPKKLMSLKRPPAKPVSASCSVPGPIPLGSGMSVGLGRECGRCSPATPQAKEIKGGLRQESCGCIKG